MPRRVSSSILMAAAITWAWRLERLASHVREVGQRVLARHVQGLEQLGRLLHVEVRELAEVIVDGLNLVEVVHGNSRVKVKGKTGGTKKPRGVHEEHHGVLKRVLGCVYCSVPVGDVNGMIAV